MLQTAAGGVVLTLDLKINALIIHHEFGTIWAGIVGLAFYQGGC